MKDISKPSSGNLESKRFKGFIRSIIITSLILNLSYSCTNRSTTVTENENKIALDKKDTNLEHNTLYADSIFTIADKQFDAINYTGALKNYLESYDIYFKYNEDKKAYWASASIARIFLNNKAYMNALHYYEKSLSHLNNFDYIPGKFIIYTELLALATNMNEKDLFDEYYTKGISLFDSLDGKKINGKTKKTYILFLLGSIRYYLLNNENDNKNIYSIFGRVETLLDQTPGLKSEFDNNKDLLLISGKIKIKEGNLQSALQYFNNIEKDTSYKNIAILKSMAYGKYIIYKNIGDYQGALKYKEIYDNYNDKLITKSQLLEITKLEKKYESDKKDAEIKQQNAEIRAKEAEVKISKEKEKKETRTKWGLLAILGMGGLGGAWIFKKYKDEKKGKELSQKQKATIELKNKDINASLQYAKRIQYADLTPIEGINKLFPGNFILYKPRDLVSGDFYRGKEINGKKFFTMLDSTGHGVPGAMLSSKGLTILNTISAENDNSPGNILKLINTSIHKIRENYIQEDDKVKDTMEGSIFSYDSSNGDFTLSGSKGEILLFPKGELEGIKIGKNKGFFIKEYINKKTGRKYYALKTQKNDLGETSDYPFENYTINIKNGIVYLYSDGYQDQFGGHETLEKSKKFKKKNFRNLVEDISNIPDMLTQKRILTEKIETRKNKNNQTDDITVIGIRLKTDD